MATISCKDGTYMCKHGHVGGGVVDCSFVKDCETVTYLTIDTAAGTVTYTNEAGQDYTFPIGGVNIVDNADYTWTVTLPDGTTEVIGGISADADQLLELGTDNKPKLTCDAVVDCITTNGISADPNNQLILGTDGKLMVAKKVSPLVKNPDGTITYTDEDGVVTTFMNGGSIVPNGDGTYTVTNPDGTTQTIADTSISPLVKNPDGTYTYTDETGVVTTVTVGDSLVDNGDGTYTVTKPDGSTVTIADTTPTTLVQNPDGTYTHTNELGVTQTIVPGDNVVDNGDGTYTVTNPDGTTFNIASSDDQTASEVPMTAITAGSTVFSGPSTQDALGQAAAEIEALKNVPQIWAKDATQTTNVTPHLESDEARRTGAVVIGALTPPTASATGGVTKLDLATGDMDIQNTTATDGAVSKNGVLWSHNYGPNNTFYGINSGNRTLTGNGNQGNGENSLRSLTSGYYNSANGFGTLLSNTTGYENTATGASALLFNTTGRNNTANGANSMYNNISGVFNTAIGFNSLFSNIDGNYNLASGSNSMYSNTSGTFNTAVGTSALYNNTTANQNTATGYESMYLNTTGYNNVANGYQSLYNNTTGFHNTAIGFSAMYSNTTGYFNSATGYAALYSNTTGYYNTADGVNAMYSNTTGALNSAQGYNALYSNTTGNYNTADGVNSMYSNTSGSENTATGYSALYTNTTGTNNAAHGLGALYYNTTQSRNSAYGDESFNNFNALSAPQVVNASTTTELTLSVPLTGTWAVGDHINLQLGSPFSNSISGFYSGAYEIVNATTVKALKPGTVFGLTGSASMVQPRQPMTIDNSTALGYNAEPTQSNQVMLGDTNTTEVRSTGAFFGASFNVVSDQRAKKNIEFISKKKINGKEYNFYRYNLTQSGKLAFGFILQELLKGGDKNLADMITKSRGVDYNATLENINKILKSHKLQEVEYLTDFGDAQLDAIFDSKMSKEGRKIKRTEALAELSAATSALAGTQSRLTEVNEFLDTNKGSKEDKEIQEKLKDYKSLKISLDAQVAELVDKINDIKKSDAESKFVKEAHVYSEIYSIDTISFLMYAL